MTGRGVVTDAELARLRAELPRPDADPWLRVPWQLSLARALRAAVRQNKPLVVVVRSGHPLGCVCNNGLVDRASITENPEVATLLATRYVPVAIDQHIHRRLDDAEGRLFAELMTRAGRFLDVTAQGVYVFTTSGQPLAFRSTQDPSSLKKMLVSALKKAQSSPPSSASIDLDADADFAPAPPAEVAVLDVISKVLGGYGEPSDYRERILQSAHGRDRCWIRHDEVESLSEDIVPCSLLARMARFHLVDNTRGEPPMWRADQIRAAEATLHDGRFAGSVRIETARGRRGFEASLLGEVHASGGVLTRFDVVAHGVAWGRGYFNAGAPAGKYPLAVRFSLSQGALAFDAIPPGAARTRNSAYLGLGSDERYGA